MKLTKTKLKRIIKEEIDVLMEEKPPVDLKTGVQELYDNWHPETDEGQLYKDQLGELIGQGRLEEKKAPSEASLKKTHKSLEKTAKKKFPDDKERRNKYVYGAKRKMGWKPEIEK